MRHCCVLKAKTTASIQKIETTEKTCRDTHSATFEGTDVRMIIPVRCFTCGKVSVLFTVA
jgi:hypothetical protein